MNVPEEIHAFLPSQDQELGLWVSLEMDLKHLCLWPVENGGHLKQCEV